MIEAIAMGAGIAFACGLLLALAARYLSVPSDPRVEQLIKLLPGVNCGACGYPGCAELAKAIAAKKETAGVCPVCDAQNRREIAAVFGVDLVVEEVRRTALVMCGGSLKTAGRRFTYNGIAECAAAAAVAGGDKSCAFGCLGYGTCAHVCIENAIAIKDGLAVVDRARCVSCGKCATACPRKLIRMVRERKGPDIHVLCSSPEKGAAVRKVCANGCTGCKVCLKLAPEAFKMRSEFLVARDYLKPPPANPDEVAAKCPGRCIHRA